jgi:hypothetical protein
LGVEFGELFWGDGIVGILDVLISTCAGVVDMHGGCGGVN